MSAEIGADVTQPGPSKKARIEQKTMTLFDSLQSLLSGDLPTYSKLRNPKMKEFYYKCTVTIANVFSFHAIGEYLIAATSFSICGIYIYICKFNVQVTRKTKLQRQWPEWFYGSISNSKITTIWRLWKNL